MAIANITNNVLSDSGVATSSLLTTSAAASTYLPLAGGTLTGNLNGTTASFENGVNLARTSGNVGIGIDAGSEKLEVFSGSSRLVQKFRTSTNGLTTTYASANATVGFIGNGLGLFSTATETQFGIRSESDLLLGAGGGVRLTIAAAGAANFSSSLGIGGATNTLGFLEVWKSGSSIAQFSIGQNATYHTDFFVDTTGNFYLQPQGTTRLTIASTGAATFSSGSETTSVSMLSTGTACGLRLQNTGSTASDWIIQSDGGAVAGQAALRFYSITAAAYRMSIDGSGKVGIGTASPPSTFSVQWDKSTQFAGAAIYDQQVFNASDHGGTLAFGGTFNSAGAYTEWSSIGGMKSNTTDGNVSGDINFYTRLNGSAMTERMRITSGGAFKSTNTGVYGSSSDLANEFNSGANLPTLRLTNSRTSGGEEMIRCIYSGFTPNNSSSWFIYANDPTTARFYVTSAGGIGNFQANNVNLSDERTKKDIEPLESYWDKFKAIEIVKFKYKDQTHDDFNIGVIAQQVESVAPEFVDVDGWDNNAEGHEIVSEEEPLKSIYTADLYHATIKVLQEAMQKIEELRAELDELKSK